MTIQQLADRVISIEEDLNQIKPLLQQNLKITPDIEDPWINSPDSFLEATAECGFQASNLR